VIYVWLGFFLLLAAGGLFWYVLNDLVTGLLDELEAMYPGLLDQQVLAFIRSVWHWLPLLILVGGLVWVYVQSQRRAYPEGYL